MNERWTYSNNWEKANRWTTEKSGPEIPRPKTLQWRVLDKPIGEAQQRAWEVRNTQNVESGDEPTRAGWEMQLRNTSKYPLLWILHTSTIEIRTEKWNPGEDTSVA